MAEAFPAPEYGPYPCQVEVPLTTNGLAKLATRGALPGGCSAVLELGIGTKPANERSTRFLRITTHEDGIGQLHSMAAYHGEEKERASSSVQAGHPTRPNGDRCLEQVCNGGKC